ncbi:hypothetical protein BDZ94DRAFT_1303813 [Collybia nuda]|uniref:LIM zinc-binding domain-containing protein n=1 Tax=Collybia nuda TaxID=64659 RepID=A0A9P5YHE4_9AGAR|nr:hypothetical protein BDZ94DRAFT_1303813 [Collybia nuda]
MAPLLSPAPANGPTRISQILPTVKCSNCNQPVPLSELGDHTCATPPPVPTLPKPAVSPAAATALLPQRLQDRVASPGPAQSRAPSNDSRLASSPPRAQPPSQQRPNPPQNDRLRINTGPPSSSSYQQRSSPLARSEIDRNNTSSPAGRPPHGAPPPNTEPLHRPPPLADFRSRTMSNAGSVSSGFSGHSGVSSPVTARPSFSLAREAPPPPSTPLPATPQLPPQPMSPLHPPYISEADIDTKSGGEAGMAGVGRRGFAAAARAAMFVMPSGQPGSQQPPRRAAPGYLGIHVPPTRSNGTPPLSAGSGHSSHSPGVSPYPQSPASPNLPHSPPRRTPSAASQQPPRQTSPIVEPPAPVSPASPVRMPFFEKFKNQLPGVTVPNPNTTPLPNAITSNINTPSTAMPPTSPRIRDSDSGSTSSAYSQMFPSRSISMSTTTSRDDPKQKRPPSPSSESGSEYGLAYADSTDYEEEEEDTKSTKSKANLPPPLALTSSILRSGSIASTNHVRFPSNSDRSDRSGIVIQDSRTGHKRDASVSSVSSNSSAGGGDRNGKSNSALIAHALGLSQTSPSAYGRLGGPGVAMGGRGGRSASGSSSGGRSAYSRGSNSAVKTGQGKMEKEMETLLEDVNAGVLAEERKGSLSKSNSTGKKRSFGAESAVDNDARSAGVKTAGLVGAKAHRSNTVPGPYSPEAKTVKLPARARTSSERNTEPGREKERVRKVRVCLKCEKKIEDGRWVKTDGAGVLCEKCWKNMYLPKCRRCTLPIEKQAVSSSDGQLKGKYHRECFNCHTCHKPFPDKTFYVFDGKPLCAYHYHEANDSLCAAARCGQPIEGPCAVSHTGDRYHPEHMTCEHPGNTPCKVRLAEYWEVEGRMLCERHAHASRVGSDDEGEEEWVQSSKAMKRVTRFIDLAGKDGLGGSDLR